MPLDRKAIPNDLRAFWMPFTANRQFKSAPRILVSARAMHYGSANRPVGIAPEGIEHVVYCNSGSEAVDTALKIALAWHRARGDGARTRLIGRKHSCHGVGFGGISAGGNVNNRRVFGSLLVEVDHLPHTHLPENAFTAGQPGQGGHLAEELERIVAPPGKRAIDVFVWTCEAGILIRVTGDIIAMSPPLIISKPQIDELIGTLADVPKAAA